MRDESGVGDPTKILWRSAEERRRIAARVLEHIGAYRGRIERERVEPHLARLPFGGPRAVAESFDFAHPMDPIEAIDRVSLAMKDGQVHVAHPGYFGLFNPASAAMGIAGDALAAGFNPQLATHSHSPFAVEAERHVVRSFARAIVGESWGDAGATGNGADGTFCSGGAEANHTALLVALVRAFPNFRSEGLRSLPAAPTIYVTSETHDSVVKAASLVGLGSSAVKRVGVDEKLRMCPGELERAILADRDRGAAPFLVVGTAGTTSAGIIDPLDAVGALAAREGAWFHVDAAWGGAARLLGECRDSMSGIERADSVTLDAHKWLSVPMGAGLFLTRHASVLERTFAVEATYMPRCADGAPDPYLRSMSWSRRFIGLKVLLSLAVAGWPGYASVVRAQVALGDHLRDRVVRAGFRVVNETPLPLVCFVDGKRPDGDSSRYLRKLQHAVTHSGRSWISVTRLGPERRAALRACITSFDTREEHIGELVASLVQARQAIAVA